VGRIEGFCASKRKANFLRIDAKAGGLDRSDDGGLNWQRMAEGKRIGNADGTRKKLRGSQRPDTVYVRTPACIARATAERLYGVQKAGREAMTSSVMIYPDEPRRMIRGTDQGNDHPRAMARE